MQVVESGFLSKNGLFYSEIQKNKLEDEILEQVKTYFNITEEQSYSIYKSSKGNVIVMIFGKTDLIIQDVRAFKVVQ